MIMVGVPPASQLSLRPTVFPALDTIYHHDGMRGDPSFNVPIYADLFEGGDGHTLIWSRARRQNGD